MREKKWNKITCARDTTMRVLVVKNAHVYWAASSVQHGNESLKTRNLRPLHCNASGLGVRSEFFLSFFENIAISVFSGSVKKVLANAWETIENSAQCNHKTINALRYQEKETHFMTCLHFWHVRKLATEPRIVHFLFLTHIRSDLRMSPHFYCSSSFHWFSECLIYSRDDETTCRWENILVLKVSLSFYPSSLVCLNDFISFSHYIHKKELILQSLSVQKK